MGSRNLLEPLPIIANGGLIMDIKELAKWIESNYTEEEINTYIKIKEAEMKKLREIHKNWTALCKEGERLEKEGETLQAIVLYESLLADNFDGSHPYDRLAILYKKLKRPDDVIRVLEKAVYVFEKIVYKERADRNKKLENYKAKLEKAKQL
jgi:tetratricopeptide (TPR) repeat protein